MAKEGRNFNDRELASQVRSLCLNEIKDIFEYKPGSSLNDEPMADMKKQLILKMSTSILPRLNELSGTDGEPLQVVVPLPVAQTFHINATDKQTGGSDKE